jgi:hypothetical protein
MMNRYWARSQVLSVLRDELLVCLVGSDLTVRLYPGIGHSNLQSCQTPLHLTDAFPRTLFDPPAVY